MVDIRAIPKVEHHVHLEGTVTPEMLTTLAARNNVPIPDGVITDDNVYCSHEGGLEAFLKTYDAVAACIKTAQDYEDITYDYLVRSAKRGVIFTEIMYSPYHSQEYARLSHEETIKTLSKAMDRAKHETGIESRLICTAVRHVENAKDVAEDIATYLSHNRSDYVTGFGLAGAEQEDDVLSFRKAFQIAHNAGLSLTAHAGENAGPKSVWNTLRAVPEIKRIGHGVRSLEDKVLMRELARRGILLEVCPSSNAAMKVYKGAPDVSKHPLPKLMKAGLKCSLNSDDPPFFNTDILKEFRIAHDALGLSEQDLLEITKDSIDAAFAPKHVKRKLHETVQRRYG